RWPLALLAIGLLPAAPPAAQEEQQGWSFDGRALRNDRHDFLLELIGYGQADGRRFPDWNVTDEAIHNPSTDFPRRLRLGLDTRWKNLVLDIEADPQDDKEHLKNAYAELRFGRALRFRAGNMKVPVTREWLT